MSQSKLHGVDNIEIQYIDGLVYPKIFNDEHDPINYIDGKYPHRQIRVYNRSNGGHYTLERPKGDEMYEVGEEVVVFRIRENEIGGYFGMRSKDKDPTRALVVSTAGERYKLDTLSGSWASWVCYKVIHVWFPK